MSGIAQTTSDLILGMIRKESWILDHFFKSYRCFQWSISHLANNIALAEVCGL